MKFRKKYLFPPFLTLFWFALGGAIVLLVDIGVSLGYDYLCEILPGIFYRPGIVTDPEGHERVYRALTLTVLMLTVLPVTYFSMRLDNNRFEYLVTLTEGLYPIRERAVWHLKTFWLSDIIAASAAPVLLTLPVFFIPEDYSRFFLPIFWCGGRLSEFFGPVASVTVILLMSLSARIILLPSVLKAWRAGWLTGSID